MKLITASLLLLFALDTTACELVGGSCTDIGCVNSLSLTVTHGDGAWAAGSYAITVDVAGTPVTFQCAVAGGESRCDPPASAPPGLSVEPVLASGAVEAFAVKVESAPRRVQLEVAPDGAAALTKTVSPTYTHSRPNGPDCGPVCSAGSEAVEL
ncbi:MAG: hypothetical protein U1F43_01455 [Myxococcota bacterium]